MQGVGPGSLLGTRYAVHQRLSRHANWERWSAADTSLERDVVVLCFARDSQQADATLDAARRAAGVEESRLTRVLDVGQDSGSNSGLVFVVEEPMTGAATLTALLSEGGLPADEVRRIVGESASGLAAAATRGLHHGVLTPRDVLVLPDGSVKVRGLATHAALMGEDDRPSDQASRADAVALAGLLYAGLTGRWPLPGPDAGLEAAPRLVSGVAAPSEIAAGVPGDIDVLVTGALSENGGPRTPSEVVEQLYPGATGPGRTGLVPGSVAAARVSTARTNPLPRDPVTGGVARADRPSAGRAGQGGGSGSAKGSGRAGAASSARPTGGAAAGVRGGGRLWRRGSRPGTENPGPADVGGGGPGNQSAQPAAGPGQDHPVVDRSPQADEAAQGGSGVTRSGSGADEPRASTPGGDSGAVGVGHRPARLGSRARGPASHTEDARGPSQHSENGSNEPGASGASAGRLPGAVVAVTTAAGSAVAGATGSAAKTVGKGVRSVAGAVGTTAATVADQVGRAARTTADRAAERSASKAERRRFESMPDDLFEAQEASLTDVLVETDEELEPSVPPRLAPDAPSVASRPESKLALAIVAAFVVLAAIIGFWGLPQIGALPTSSTPSSPSRSASAGPTTAGAQGSAATEFSLTPVTIVASAGFEPTNGGQVPSNSAGSAHDGNLASGWTSKWFTTAKFGGLPMQGIGLIVNFGQPIDVRRVTLNLPAEQDATVYVANQASLDGATAIGSFTGKKGEVVLDTPGGAPVTGELVIVFVTRLGPDGAGKFRGQVSEIQVSS